MYALISITIISIDTLRISSDFDFVKFLTRCEKSFKQKQDKKGKLPCGKIFGESCGWYTLVKLVIMMQVAGYKKQKKKEFKRALSKKRENIGHFVNDDLFQLTKNKNFI